MRMIVYWLLFSGWSFLYFGIKAELANRRNREHAHRAESALLRAELNLLRSQLDPHFLFNSLNGIAAEIPLHPDRALNMTRELADYLRFSLDHRNHATVPFRAELDAMAAYLRIEQARFGDQLAISIDPSGVGADRPIPAFTLQPLVENAVKHALRTSEPPWTISLKVTAEPEALVITVRNSGKLQPAVEPDRPRIGLDLLRRRLALSYPGKHLLSLDQEGGFVRAVLTLQGVPCA
jgi:LytS/YehU family sensor histidine kinase